MQTKQLPGSFVNRLNIPNSRVKVPPPAVDVTYGKRKDIWNNVRIKTVNAKTYIMSSYADI